MSIPFILLPFFVEVALIFALLIGLSITRGRALRSGETRIEDVSRGERAWSGRAQLFANSYENQFELPLLFFAIAPLAILTRKADYPFVILAWIFVLLRFGHAYVHVTSNHALWRPGLFAGGVVVLLIMWVLFALQILTGL